MEIPSIHQKLARLDAGGSGFDDLPLSLRDIDGALFNDLDGTFKISLSIEDVESVECNHNVNRDDYSNDGNKQKELELVENKSSKKCLIKSKSFPFPAVTSPLNDPSDNDTKPETGMGDVFSNESVHQAIARSISLPAPVKPISAMKGSRAQHYGSSPKLSVKWAPDVYDPTPTSMSHSGKNNKKQQKSKNRKNGKKGQKGSSNSVRGSGGRDKKQGRKAIGSKDRYQRSFDSHQSLVSTANEFEGFDDGSSDSHCGTMFLKTSVTKVPTLLLKPCECYLSKLFSSSPTVSVDK